MYLQKFLFSTCLVTGLVLLASRATTEEKVNPDIDSFKTLGLIQGAQLGRMLEFSDEEIAWIAQGLVEGLALRGKEPENIRSKMAAMEALLKPRMKPRSEAAQAAQAELQQQIMASLTLPMDLEISDSQGGKTTLAKLCKDKKAVLLDFWATWCGRCMQLMPELKIKATKLAPAGVVVAGMNTQGVYKAESKRESLGIDFPWLVEPEGLPFSAALNIDYILPYMILVSPEGKVLYNGPPSDDALSAALSKLGVKL